ncbi:hypothetical protein DB346_06215 [Verrucomicrobia bacterium LW23]|nr:hypothetical protein DB346_06215 [Verrucomicrobia bacterium LW23]
MGRQETTMPVMRWSSSFRLSISSISEQTSRLRRVTNVIPLLSSSISSGQMVRSPPHVAGCECRAGASAARRREPEGREGEDGEGGIGLGWGARPPRKGLPAPGYVTSTYGKMR